MDVGATKHHRLYQYAFPSKACWWSAKGTQVSKHVDLCPRNSWQHQLCDKAGSVKSTKIGIASPLTACDVTDCGRQSVVLV